MIRVGSLFSGYEGLGMAVEAVLGGRIAWQCESDPHASLILAHHHPGVPNHGDITQVDWASVEPVDVLTAGFPCQPVSAAGKRKGTADERWLFDEVLRAVGGLASRPRLLVLENVVGLLTANSGDAMARVVQGLAACGYVGRYRVVRAADAGAPHSRARVFVVAENADGAAGDQRGLAAPGQAAGGRARADAGGSDRARDHRPAADAGGDGREGRSERDRGPFAGVGASQRDDVDRRGDAAADASGDGRHEGRPEPAGLVRGPDAAERRHGAPADAEREQPERLRAGRVVAGESRDAEGPARQRERGRACPVPAARACGVCRVTDYLPARAVERAQRLVYAVHECGPEATAAILEPLDRQDLYALAVTLAAMVDPEKRPSELLAWCEPKAAGRRSADRDRKRLERAVVAERFGRAPVDEAKPPAPVPRVEPTPQGRLFAATREACADFPIRKRAADSGAA